MRNLIRFELEQGGSVIVEVEDREPQGSPKVGRGGNLIAESRVKFEQAIDSIKPAATVLIAKLKEISDSVDEIGIEFGITLNSETDAFIARAGMEANFKVTVSWKRRDGQV
jgi:hypothetical protein